MARSMSDPQPHQFCILCSTDLFFVSRIENTAKSLGIHVETLNSSLELYQHLKANCILLDLAINGLNVAELMENLPIENRPVVIAFGAHVHGDQLKAAQQAGCDLVLTKNQLTNQLADLLKQHCVPKLKPS